jgi:hypothetical protein
MLKSVVLAAAVLMPQVAWADAGTDFIAKLQGSWSGAGTIRVSANDAPAATRCALQARGGGASLQISGSCDGAARGANLSVSLNWVAATQQFTGTFSGAAESGSASLYGRLNGSTLSLAVTSSNGGRSSMTLTLQGSKGARLSVSGRDRAGRSVQYVTLPLSRS